MGTLTIPHTIADGNAALGSQVAANFAAIATHSNASLIHKDGSVAMTGPLLLSDGSTAVGATSGTFTPSLLAASVNPTLGSGSSRVGKWWKDGGWVTAEILITFGSSGADRGSGLYLVTLPFSISADHSNYCPLGDGAIFDASSTANPAVTVSREGSSQYARIHIGDASAGAVSDVAPWSWTINDNIIINVRYRFA